MVSSPFNFESAEQLTLFNQYRQKWYDITHSTDRVDQAAIKYLIDRIYELCGLDLPQTIFVDSPYQIMLLLPGQLQATTYLFSQQEVKQSLKTFVVRPNQPGFGYLTDGLIKRAIHIGDKAGHYLGQFAEMVFQSHKLIYTLLDYSEQTEIYQPYLSESLYCLPTSAMVAWAFFNDFSQHGLSVSLPFTPEVQLFLELAEYGGLCLPFQQFCIVCDRPTRLLKNSEGKFHAEDEPAIQFADGYSLYVKAGKLINEGFWNRDTDATQWVSLWSEEQTKQLTHEQLRYMAYRHPAVACLLAQDSTTSPQLLYYLSFLKADQETIHKHLTRNPSTPIDLLLKLAARYPKEFLENPTFIALMQKYPAFPENVVLNVLQNLAKEDIFVAVLIQHSPELLEEVNLKVTQQLLSSDDTSLSPSVQRSVELLEKLPLKMLRELFMQDDVPLTVMEELADRPEEAIKLMLLAHPKTPESVLKRLVEASTPAIAHAIPLHVNWSEPLEQDWYEFALHHMKKTLEDFWFDHDALDRLAEIGALPEWAVYQLKGRESYLSFLTKAARSPLTPMNILEKLTNQSNYEIKAAAASNPLTTADILEELAEGADSYVLQQVLRHPNTPVHFLESWMQQEIPTLCYAIACNPHAPTEVVAGWIRRLDWQSATQFAKISDSPANFLEQLATHPHPAVLPVIAAHPHTPSHLLEQWAKIPDDNLRLTLVNNPATPAQTLFTLLAENSEWGKAIAARFNGRQSPHPELATQISEYIAATVPDFESIFLMLVHHKNYAVRAFVAALPDVPTDLLESLLNDPSSTVLLQLAKNPQMPEKALDSLLDRVIQTEQLAPLLPALCQNPNISLKTVVAKLDQLDSYLTKAIFPELLQRCAIEAPELLPSLLQVNLKYSCSVMKNLMFLGLLHPLANQEVLSSMAQSLTWLNRYAVTQNSRTSSGDLEKLARDANQIVRAAARERLRQRGIRS